MQDDNVTQTVVDEGTETNYIDTINQLKANSVSKEQYQKVVNENKQLLDSLVNGRTLDSDELPKKLSKEELRTNLFDKELTNLEFCENALELRKQILEESGQDIFLPNGRTYVPNDSDKATAEKVAEVMQECVDYAQGDPQAFTNELMRRTNESPNIYKRR